MTGSPSEQPDPLSRVVQAAPASRMQAICALVARCQEVREHDSDEWHGIAREAVALLQQAEPASQPARSYGCHQCGRDYSWSPLTFSVSGIPARTFYFCSPACLEDWHAGKYAEVAHKQSTGPVARRLSVNDTEAQGTEPKRAADQRSVSTIRPSAPVNGVDGYHIPNVIGPLDVAAAGRETRAPQLPDKLINSWRLVYTAMRAKADNVTRGALERARCEGYATAIGTCIKELAAARQETPAAPPAHILELAREGAKERHREAILALRPHKGHEDNGQLDLGFAVCPHADCKLFAPPASVSAPSTQKESKC